MLFVSSLFVSTLSLLSLVHACNPNFEGASVSVVQGDKEWSAATPEPMISVLGRPKNTSPPGTLYRFEQTGAFPTSYIIKDVRASANDIVVAASGPGLKLAQINSSDSLQIFKVECDVCRPNISQLHGQTVASGCRIIKSTGGLCVAYGTGRFSGVLRLQVCTEDVPEQIWSFTTPP